MTDYPFYTEEHDNETMVGIAFDTNNGRFYEASVESGTLTLTDPRHGDNDPIGTGKPVRKFSGPTNFAFQGKFVGGIVGVQLVNADKWAKFRDKYCNRDVDTHSLWGNVWDKDERLEKMIN